MNKDILIEKFKKIYKKYKSKLFYIFGIFIIMIIHIFLIYCLKLNENEIKNIYKDIFGTIGIIFLAYSFLFNLQNTEKFLIKNITLVSLLSIIIILYFQKDLGIKENDKILLMIGAIFAFWYGYKKYEMDKELNIFYTKLGDINNKKYEEIINEWENILYLYEEGYLSKKFFLKIEVNFINYLQEYLLNEKNEINKRLEISKLILKGNYFTEKLDFIANIFRELYEDLDVKINNGWGGITMIFNYIKGKQKIENAKRIYEESYNSIKYVIKTYEENEKNK